MLPDTFIFFGRSGSGKGTQAELLMQALKERGARDMLYIETGALFRSFVTDNKNLTSTLTGNVMNEGGFLPPFLPIWIWTNYLIHHFTGKETLVLDGLCRKAHEAPILDSALSFYGREKVHVILVDVSREWSHERLLGRKRGDDTEERILNRLNAYDKDVIPAMEYLKNDPKYIFHTINGEQTIEEVHAEIISKLGLA